MNIEKRRSQICSTIPILLAEGVLLKNGCLSCRSGESILITPLNSDLFYLSPKDLVEIRIDNNKGEEDTPTEHLRHLALYSARPDIQAIIHSTSPAVSASSRTGKRVYPLLDDMAQIVGINIKTAPAGEFSKSLKKIIRAAQGRNAVFIKDEGALCFSTSLDDAHAVCQVCEKACKAFIESSYLGGGYKIPLLEAWLMRVVYLKKYSRKNIENRTR